MSVNSKMTAIADKIRVLLGVTGTMGLDAMATNLGTEQTNVINAFTAIGNMGGTVPSSKVSGNLASAINTIKTGFELNFEVVGGTSQPANPKENTIWVNTSTAVTGWHFSATQPSNPTSGDVWFEVSTSSNTAFNALKENNITVYPVSAKQYVKSSWSGSWKDVTAKVYQNNKWNDWTITIISNGSLLVAAHSNVATKTEQGVSGAVKFSETSNGHFAINFACNGNAGKTIYAEVTGGKLHIGDGCTGGLILVQSPITGTAASPTGVASTSFNVDSSYNVTAKTYELKIPTSFSSGYFAIHGEPHNNDGHVYIKNLYIK